MSERRLLAKLTGLRAGSGSGRQAPKGKGQALTAAHLLVDTLGSIVLIILSLSTGSELRLASVALGEMASAATGVDKHRPSSETSSAECRRMTLRPSRSGSGDDGGEVEWRAEGKKLSRRGWP